MKAADNQARDSACDDLSRLMQRGSVWRARRQWHLDQPEGDTRCGISTGVEALDEVLGGGWPRGELLELLLDRAGCGEVRLLLPLMHRCERVVWFDPPWQPHAAALAAAGLDLSRLVIVRTRHPRQRLWAMEQALKSGCCDLVLGWFAAVQGQWLRRLQLAVAAGGGHGALMRPADFARQGSVAPWRLRLSAPDQSSGDETAPLSRRIKVHAFKRKGAMPARAIDITLADSRLSPPCPRPTSLPCAPSGERRSRPVFLVSERKGAGRS